MGSGWLPRVLAFGAGLCGFAAVRSCGGFITPIGIDLQSLGVALVLFFVFLALGSEASAASRDRVTANQMRENELATDPSLPFALLLRPFTADNGLLVSNPTHYDSITNYAEKDIPMVRLLAEALKPNLQLRVISGSPTGPGAVQVIDSDWRERFRSLSRDAVGIVMILARGKELPWEMEQLRGDGHLAKTVFIIPPSVKGAIAANQAFFDSLRQKGFKIPFPKGKASLVSVDANGRAFESIEIRNMSYRRIRSVLLRRWRMS